MYILRRDIVAFESDIYLQTLKKNQLILPIISEKVDDYPINSLRNLAIEKVQTSHVFVADLDAWPSRIFYFI